MKRLLRYKFLLIALVLYVVTAFVSRDIAASALQYLKGFALEMIQILPPVMLLTSLIGIWVPRELIMKGFGSGSAWKGRLLSLLMGTLSAGPIYAAFPAVAMLLSKGASVSNAVIIISSWAVIKLPMLITEASFLGIPFTLTRYLVTVPLILLISEIIGRRIPSEQMPAVAENQELMRLQASLPGMNCGACGYADCAEFARAVLSGYRDVEQCKVLKKNG